MVTQRSVLPEMASTLLSTKMVRHYGVETYKITVRVLRVLPSSILRVMVLQKLYMRMKMTFGSLMEQQELSSCKRLGTAARHVVSIQQLQMSTMTAMQRLFTHPQATQDPKLV